MKLFDDLFYDLSTGVPEKDCSGTFDDDMTSVKDRPSFLWLLNTFMHVDRLFLLHIYSQRIHRQSAYSSNHSFNVYTAENIHKIVIVSCESCFDYFIHSILDLFKLLFSICSTTYLIQSPVNDISPPLF